MKWMKGFSTTSLGRFIVLRNGAIFLNFRKNIKALQANKNLGKKSPTTSAMVVEQSIRYALADQKLF